MSSSQLLISPLKTNVLLKISGRGLPCSPDASASLVEKDVLGACDKLAASWRRPDKKRLHDDSAGVWRLAWTSNESLRLANGIAGGPLQAVYESIGDDVVHTAFATRAPMYGVLLPAVIVFCFVLAFFLRLGFLIGFNSVMVTTTLLAALAPTGVFASRSAGLKFSDEGEMTSKLERNVVFFRAASAGFDTSLLNPMSAFCTALDKSNGARDPLKAGFLFGWRILLRPFLTIHLLHEERTRLEKILYVDEDLRIVQGGDLLKDGSSPSGVNVWVRAM